MRAVVRYGLLAGEDLAHDIDVLPGTGQGGGKGWPYHPSTTCGPDTPSPSTKRPPEMIHGLRRHGHGGRRAGQSSQSEVPSRTRPVREPHHASGVRASYRRIGSQRSRSPGGRPRDQLHRVGRRPSPPVAQLQADLYVFMVSPLGAMSDLVQYLFGEPLDSAQPDRGPRRRGCRRELTNIHGAHTKSVTPASTNPAEHVDFGRSFSER